MNEDPADVVGPPPPPTPPLPPPTQQPVGGEASASPAPRGEPERAFLTPPRSRSNARHGSSHARERANSRRVIPISTTREDNTETVAAADAQRDAQQSAVLTLGGGRLRDGRHRHRGTTDNVNRLGMAIRESMQRQQLAALQGSQDPNQRGMMYMGGFHTTATPIVGTITTVVLEEKPLILEPPLLVRSTWVQPFFHPPFWFCCMENPYFIPRKSLHAPKRTPNPSAHSEDGVGQSGQLQQSGAEVEEDESSESAPFNDADMDFEGTSMQVFQRKQSVMERICHFFYRGFCTRCTIAWQTELLLEEERRRRRVPFRFCCESFFGTEGNYRRSLWTILLLDIFTGGLPCGCCYQGLGSALYGWRLRYLTRTRYGIYAITGTECCVAMCLPMCALDQQAVEICTSGPRDYDWSAIGSKRMI